MILKSRLLLLCIAVIFSLPAPLLAGAERSAAREVKRVEVARERRFTERILGDLVTFRKLAEEDISELERQRSAIALLEIPQRESDLSDLLNWYYRYYEWLMGEEETAESDLARLSAPGALPGFGEMHFRSMADMVTGLSQQLSERVKGYLAERNRLAEIIDRRRLLQEQFRDLEEQLASLARGESEPSHRPSKRGKKIEKQLRADVRVVQTELLSLPDIDEGILKHLTVLIDQGQWEVEWLALSVQEYNALDEVYSLLPAGDHAALAKAYGRLIRTYNKGIDRLSRMSSELARKSSRLSPTGTIRDLDRSRDLSDLYDRLRHRSDTRKEELKIWIGACEAEAAELKSLRREIKEERHP
jgi:hypothetical protein